MDAATQTAGSKVDKPSSSQNLSDQGKWLFRMGLSIEKLIFTAATAALYVTNADRQAKHSSSYPLDADNKLSSAGKDNSVSDVKIFVHKYSRRRNFVEVRQSTRLAFFSVRRDHEQGLFGRCSSKLGQCAPQNIRILETRRVCTSQQSCHACKRLQACAAVAP